MLSGKKKEVMFQTICDKADEIYMREKAELAEIKKAKTEFLDIKESNRNNLKNKKLSSP